MEILKNLGELAVVYVVFVVSWCYLVNKWDLNCRTHGGDQGDSLKDIVAGWLLVVFSFASVGILLFFGCSIVFKACLSL